MNDTTMADSRDEHIAKAVRLSRFSLKRIEDGVLSSLPEADGLTCISVLEQIVVARSHLGRAAHEVGALTIREMIRDRFPDAIAIEFDELQVNDDASYRPRVIRGDAGEVLWTYSPNIAGDDRRPAWERHLEQAVGALEAADEPRFDDGVTFPCLYL